LASVGAPSEKKDSASFSEEALELLRKFGLDEEAELKCGLARALFRFEREGQPADDQERST
jgi:hypothetical protein